MSKKTTKKATKKSTKKVDKPVAYKPKVTKKKIAEKETKPVVYDPATYEEDKSEDLDFVNLEQDQARIANHPILGKRLQNGKKAIGKGKGKGQK